MDNGSIMDPSSNHDDNLQSSKLVLPSISEFKLALCQITVTNDIAANLIRARKMIDKASDLGAKLVVLPEMWVCPYSHEYFTKCAEELDGENQTPACSMMSKVASIRGITIVGGSIPEMRKGQLYNTCCVFGPDGKLIAKHRKLHLFDYYAGDASFKESDSFTAGDKSTIVETDVNLIIYPGAFNVSTGKALWELETKARAVDNQLFVAVCSPSGDSDGSYTIWGHSMVVGPSGEVKASSEQEEKLVIAEIDYSENQLQREHFPLQELGKDKLYRFLSK